MGLLTRRTRCSARTAELSETISAGLFRNARVLVLVVLFLLLAPSCSYFATPRFSWLYDRATERPAKPLYSLQQCHQIQFRMMMLMMMMIRLSSSPSLSSTCLPRFPKKSFHFVFKSQQIHCRAFRSICSVVPRFMESTFFFCRDGLRIFKILLIPSCSSLSLSLSLSLSPSRANTHSTESTGQRCIKNPKNNHVTNAHTRIRLVIRAVRRCSRSDRFDDKLRKASRNIQFLSLGLQ